MSLPNFILAYVKSAPESAALYGKVLGVEPVESSPNFVMFAFPNGMKLGLWGKNDVQPPATPAGGVELGFPVENDDEVRSKAKMWKALGLAIIQEPTKMDFGFTFTAADPDGHRLRVFAPAQM